MLSLERLTAGYDSGPVIHDISLQVGEGQIVGLIGANGAGKSTVLRAISGLVRPSAGSIRFSGQETTKLAAHRIPHLGIGHVPEGRRIFADLTVEDNLHLGAYRHGWRTARRDFDYVYDLFPVLLERRKQRAGSLSGGEQQMLALGRALMARPSLLLLDEPSLGLAPLIVRSVYRIIREIHARGVTVLLVEQNVNLALSCAHRAYVLQSGRVVLEGEAARLRLDGGLMSAYLGGGAQSGQTAHG
ncbi:ABC transporter ATP-binding protein [Paenibacillus puerhi]|uniref:ABC transporter ATP-binding protein n=1 Tax=Paenibacillus puerhi TaxID=2692622 RepID=UPI00135CAE82|nr:ABC transporter ATP-binding protein [Paenibacillus puerhi]